MITKIKIVKFEYLNNVLHLGIPDVYSKDEQDAFISLLGKELEIEHEGREIKSISLK